MKNLESQPQPSRSIPLSVPGDVQLGPILAIPTVLSELGIRPQRAFVRAGVDPRLFKDPGSRIQLVALGRLFDACVALSGCPHFGLLVGERCELKSFGPLGYLMRNCATVGEAVRSLLLHFHLHDSGAAPLLLAPDPPRVLLGYSIYRHGTPAVDQVYDAAITIGYRIMAELCGPGWKAQRVQFSHSRPSHVAPFRRVFGPSVRFDAEISGIAFERSWLDKAIEGADATLHGLLTKAIRDAEASGPLSFAEKVQGVMHQMLLSGTATAESVARLFGIHERTLRRRLEAEGKNLQEIINQTRFELAQQLLQNTGLPVSEIATALQYADPNAFSRAFRAWADLSPSQWRAAMTAGHL